MSNRIEDLNPNVMFKAIHAIVECADKGIPVCVTSTLRTAEEQKALYLQGRVGVDVVNEFRRAAGMRPITAGENSYKVTNCDGVKMKSRHQGGDAIDIVPREGVNPVWPERSDPRWKKIADIMKRSGFSWGGDWPDFPDYPHYEIA